MVEGAAGPELVALLDGVERVRLAPPRPEDMAPRRWLLGVMSVQVFVEEGVVHARLRAHLTGAAAPVVVTLGERAVVHAALVEAGATIELPEPSPIDLGGAVAALSLSQDGAPLASVRLDPAPALRAPPPRAFSHVFCRWLRDGTCETGFDLTDFLSLPEGTKYERVLSRPLEIGSVVTIAFAGRRVER